MTQNTNKNVLVGSVGRSLLLGEGMRARVALFMLCSCFVQFPLSICVKMTSNQQGRLRASWTQA